MSWKDYDDWQSVAPDARPERALADGFIAGAVVALQQHPDDYWLNSIVDLAAREDASARQAVAQLRHRMDEVRDHLGVTPGTYAPILTVTDDGELDVTAWATGFLEAIGPDLEMWAYHLDKTESGLLGLVSSHAVGPVGEAGRTRIALHEDKLKLMELGERLWEFIPSLMTALYRKKVDLADMGA